ncbi:AraC family transcriptional regulator [Tropicimonas sp. IMCC34043]|uniref:helix-turn-helix transcriptional regulator n=1 Tax=Tropicimonas sp. IMCC34043 TaxID=2248760 RepID=UPI000E231CE9|nr:AraC family transcriptional regulator [Tropicimonas sp. IMCC34043]
MTHFRQILAVENDLLPDRRSTLFSMPSDLDPHEVERVRIEIRRYFVGNIGVGEVISTGHDATVTEPNGATLVVPRAGRVNSVTTGGNVCSARPGQALFFSPNRRQTRVETAGAPHFVGIPLVIPRSELAETAARFGLHPRRQRGLDGLALTVSGTTSAEAGALIALACDLHDHVSSGAPRLMQAAAHRSWNRLLSEKMIELLCSVGAIDLPSAGDGRAGNRHVRKAIAFMREHFAEIVTMADVAEACGVGVRTLETSFREIWTQTPHQMLTEIRLEAARRQLVAADPSMSVTDIALQSGFSHLGRFSVAYRARFDEMPSQTLRRARI